LYKVTGYLSDFSDYNNETDSIKLHEETIVENEISQGVEINNFEPIVLSLYPGVKLNNQVEKFETNQLILLDGHHRWKYASKINLVNKLKCILVNFEDVKVKSYLFDINLEREKFLNYLSKAGYIVSVDGNVGISFEDVMYINKNISNVFELYRFKKIMQEENIITPILEDSSESSSLVKFTSLKPSDLISIDHLLPPKSTWITPRV
tara:strand:+ start:1408 stop:2028 length:621 start_codon:yes stop_codon:yes gene_type:complete